MCIVILQVIISVVTICEGIVVAQIVYGNQFLNDIIESNSFDNIGTFDRTHIL